MSDIESYFDYNATTPVHPKVAEIMQQYFLSDFGNASSVHSYGLAAYEGITWAREQIAKSLNASPSEIIITSGGTEADNLAIQGRLFRLARASKISPLPHLITSTIEHPAVYNTAKFLEAQGFPVTFLEVDSEGFISLEALQESITPQTALISIMTANNEIGTINPIHEIGKMARDHNIWFHTDAVQAYTKTPIDVQNDSIDMLSVSAHKFYGPKGIGFLYVKNDPDLPKNASSAAKNLDPLLYGGSQEFGMRPATENVPGIVGMGKAVEIAMVDFDAEVSRLQQLQHKIIQNLVDAIPGAALNGSRDHRLCNNTNIRLPGIAAYEVLTKLDNLGFGISVGAACHAQENILSRVLLGIGLSADQIEQSMRISIGRWTTEGNTDRLIEAIKKLF